MATGNNAPQPSAAGGAQEVFDDTIQPAPPTISSDGGVGPNNAEAPVHAGSLNTYDMRYQTHFMGLTAFNWDTTQAAGQLLWSTPIHPDKSHQWLAWDAKKYNVWAGGFDYAVKVAGTGFHAGALFCVRLPPTIEPSSIRTFNDVTAFDWKIIDPKTLEVVSMGIMDQRNVMYHYFPLDLKDRQTFGGYFAIYVSIPLNTSSTGATQISIQVFTRPSRNMTMDQLIPIRKDQPILTRPFDYENAFDFTKDKSSPVTLTKLTGFTVWSQKSLVELDYQTLNTVDFEGNLLNGESFPRLEKLQTFYVNGANKTVKEFGSSGVQWVIGTTDEKPATLTMTSTEPYFALRSARIFPNNDEHLYPPIGETTGTVVVSIYNSSETDFQQRTFAFPFKSQALTNEEKKVDTWIHANILNVSVSPMQFFYGGFSTTWNRAPAVESGKEITDAEKNLKAVLAVSFKFDELNFDLTYKKYAPPIKESIITFQSENGDVSAPFELEEVIRNKSFAGKMSPSQSMIFELWDEVAGVPIMPIRLSYKGILTTQLSTTDKVYKFDSPERYKAYFIGIIPTSTPMEKSTVQRSLQTSIQYKRNHIISQLGTA